jgi:large-conductance mechanosensitive channel
MAKKRKQLEGFFKKVKSDFQEFMYQNKIVVQGAGFATAFATKDLIESILKKVILPIIKKFYKILIIYFSPMHLNSKYKHFEYMWDVVWDVFVWLIVIFLTFLILEYFLNRYVLGMKSNVSQNEQVEFIKSKKDAQESKIIPDVQSIKKMQKAEKIEKQVKDEINKKEQEKPFVTVRDSFLV